MEQAAESFNRAALAFPVLLALIPAFFFLMGYRFSRKYPSSFGGKSLYWLGGHGITLVAATALTLMRGTLIPDMFVTQLPLIFAVAYLVLGIGLRLPFFFSIGLATPGLWLFAVKCWHAFSGQTESIFLLPEDPFWYLLAAVVVFSLQYLQKPKDFWDEAEASLVIVSGSYLMGAFWLLALGQESLLAGIGVVQWVWAIVLTAVAAALLWCANYMRDPLFAGCGVVGIAAGIYTFISTYPWS